jgi:hypothetical protein
VLKNYVKVAEHTTMPGSLTTQKKLEHKNKKEKRKLYYFSVWNYGVL